MPCARARYNEERHSLPWFRWKNKKTPQDAPDGATTEVPVPPAEPEAETEIAAADATATGEDAEALRKRRRRGSRGGRGRKRPPADGAVEPAATAEKPAKEPAREKPERSQRAE